MTLQVRGYVRVGSAVASIECRSPKGNEPRRGGRGSLGPWGCPFLGGLHAVCPTFVTCALRTSVALLRALPWRRSPAAQTPAGRGGRPLFDASPKPRKVSPSRSGVVRAMHILREVQERPAEAQVSATTGAWERTDRRSATVSAPSVAIDQSGLSCDQFVSDSRTSATGRRAPRLTGTAVSMAMTSTVTMTITASDRAEGMVVLPLCFGAS